MNPTIRPIRHHAARRTARASLAIVAVLGLGVTAVACGDDDDDPATTSPVEIVDEDFDETRIIGLPEDEARSVVEQDGRQFRVAVIDGEDQALTMDFVEGRVNVSVTDGLVDSVVSYG